MLFCCPGVSAILQLVLLERMRIKIDSAGIFLRSLLVVIVIFSEPFAFDRSLLRFGVAAALFDYKYT